MANYRITVANDYVEFVAGLCAPSDWEDHSVPEEVTLQLSKQFLEDVSEGVQTLGALKKRGVQVPTYLGYHLDINWSSVRNVGIVRLAAALRVYANGTAQLHLEDIDCVHSDLFADLGRIANVQENTNG